VTLSTGSVTFLFTDIEAIASAERAVAQYDPMFIGSRLLPRWRELRGQATAGWDSQLGRQARCR
jgi:hypothetical protein